MPTSLSLLPATLKPCDAVLVHMGDPRQAVNALDHLHNQNLTLFHQNLILPHQNLILFQQSLIPLESLFILLMGLFVLLLHVNDEFHGLRQGLMAFGQFIETLVDVHLTQ